MSTTANKPKTHFAWTTSGRCLLIRYKAAIPSSDFSITRDGGNQWVIRHWSMKSAIAVFTGENATQALRALKVALVTHRLSS